MPRLMGERIILREFRREDITGIRAWINDPEAALMMGPYYAKPQTWEQSEEYLDRILRGNAGGVQWAVAEREKQEYIGQIELSFFDYVASSAELSIVLLSGHRGAGIGGEAVLLALGFAFGQMNLNRVHLKVYADNERAVRCYQRCGFALEGRLRQDGYVNGAYRDKLIMGILRSEFEAAAETK